MNVEKWSEKELERLEKRIKKEYTKASAELKHKADDYFKQYEARWEAEHEAMINRQQGYANISNPEEAFKLWEQNQLARGEHWNRLRDEMTIRLEDAGKIAQDYTNGILPKMYTKNNNAIAMQVKVEATKNGVIGIDFELIDEETVKLLMTDSREVKPYKKMAINLAKYNRYNNTKLQNALLQGILQGDSIKQLSKRFMNVSDMSRSTAIRNARTAATGARNAGKQARFEKLADQGVEMTKIWSAVGDSRTRPEHAEADGQEVPYNEPFDVGGEELMYPGDRNGSDWNIQNCRCSQLLGNVKFRHWTPDE